LLITIRKEGFDKLSPNGAHIDLSLVEGLVPAHHLPLAPSLSKGRCRRTTSRSPWACRRAGPGAPPPARPELVEGLVPAREGLRL